MDREVRRITLRNSASSRLKTVPRLVRISAIPTIQSGVFEHPWKRRFRAGQRLLRLLGAPELDWVLAEREGPGLGRAVGALCSSRESRIAPGSTAICVRLLRGGDSCAMVGRAGDEGRAEAGPRQPEHADRPSQGGSVRHPRLPARVRVEAVGHPRPHAVDLPRLLHRQPAALEGQAGELRRSRLRADLRLQRRERQPRAHRPRRPAAAHRHVLRVRRPGRARRRIARTGTSTSSRSSASWRWRTTRRSSTTGRGAG